jgi:hypothetical protein
MAEFEHLLNAYDVGDLLDDVASADPPAYLRRCFAEGASAAEFSWVRVQQHCRPCTGFSSVSGREIRLLRPNSKHSSIDWLEFEWRCAV